MTPFEKRILWENRGVAILQKRQIAGTWNPKTPDEIYADVLALTDSEEQAASAQYQMMEAIQRGSDEHE